MGSLWLRTSVRGMLLLALLAIGTGLAHAGLELGRPSATPVANCSIDADDRSPPLEASYTEEASKRRVREPSVNDPGLATPDALAAPLPGIPARRPARVEPATDLPLHRGDAPPRFPPHVQLKLQLGQAP